MSNVAERFNRPLHRVAVPSNRLALPFAKVGVEMEVENYTLSPVKVKQLLPNWDLHKDENSLKLLGMELVTRGGLVGEELLSEVQKFVDVAIKHKFSEGYPRAGLHLHIDVTDMNGDNSTEMLNMVSAYMLFEEAVFGFAGEWRKACGFCDSWLGSQHDYPNLAHMLVDWENFEPTKLNSEGFSKYQALNFLPLARLGTLEFRHMPMTLDYKRIIDWINICLCFKRFGMQANRDPVDILIKDGAEALINAVFGGFRDIITPYVNIPDLYEAVPDVLALKLWSSVQPMDPWGRADNPLLAMKERNLKAAPVKRAAGLKRKPVPRRPVARPIDPQVNAAMAEMVARHQRIIGEIE